MADLRERPDVETIIRFRSKMGELWANAHNEFRDNDDYVIALGIALMVKQDRGINTHNKIIRLPAFA